MTLYPGVEYELYAWAAGRVDANSLEAADIIRAHAYSAIELTCDSPLPPSEVVIPEPSALAIWSAIALGGLGLAYRRRKKMRAG